MTDAAIDGAAGGFARPALAPGIVARDFAFDAYVVGAAFDGAGGTAAFALGDGTLRLVDLADAASAPRTAPAHDGACLSLATAPDGQAFLSGGDDGKLLRVGRDGAASALLDAGSAWIEALAAHPGSGLIACGAGKHLHVIDPKGKLAPRRFANPSTVQGVAFEPVKGLRLAAAHYNAVSLWWAKSGEEQAAKPLAWKGSHIAATWSPDGRFVVSSLQESALHGWRVADEEDMRMSGYPSKVRSLSWTAKGKFLATAGADRVVCWPFQGKDGPMGKRPLELSPWGCLVTQVAAHDRHDIVATGLEDGAVVLEMLVRDAAVSLAAPGGGKVTALAWSPDGLTLAYGTEEGRAGLVRVPG